MPCCRQISTVSTTCGGVCVRSSTRSSAGSNDWAPIETRLTPEALKTKETSLYGLGVLLGTDRRIGGFRGYGANLDPKPAAKDPLFHALVRLLDLSGTSTGRPVAFG